MTRPSENIQVDLQSALEGLKGASARLTEIAARAGAGSPQQSWTANDAQADAQVFYENLQVNGQIADVNDSTDLANLPPGITHVRYPDGRVERIGFS